VSLAVGNYSRTSFGFELAAKLTAASPTSSVYTVTGSNTFTTADNGKYTIGTGYVGAVSFIFGNSSIADRLGFNRGSTVTWTSSVESVNVIDMQSEQTIEVRMDIIDATIDNILQLVMPGAVAPYSAIMYQASILIPRKVTTDSTNTIRIWLTDEDGNVIDLNGGECVYVIGWY
jgi:hypothetical protein